MAVRRVGLAAQAARLGSPSFGAFVAVDEPHGRVLGSGGISIYDNPPGPDPTTREACVMSMFTEPDARGRGVARAVLEALLDFAREAGGVGRVWLRASEMGRPVYLRAGSHRGGRTCSDGSTTDPHGRSART